MHVYKARNNCSYAVIHEPAKNTRHWGIADQVRNDRVIAAPAPQSPAEYIGGLRIKPAMA